MRWLAETGYDVDRAALHARVPVVAWRMSHP